MKGEKDVKELINLSKHDNKGKKTAKIQKQKTMTRKKKSRINKSGYICPIDCLQNIVKKYEEYSLDNIHYMCISFILRNTEEVVIKADTFANVATNHTFVKRKKKDMSGTGYLLREIEENLSYHLQAENQIPVVGLVTDPRQCQMRQHFGEQFTVKIFNFNSEDVILHPNTNICKIYIYSLKQATNTNDII